MRGLLRLLITCLLACVIAPVFAQDPLVKWQYEGRKSFEEREPGLGTTDRYSSPIGWADVFRYDMRQSWPNDTHNAAFLDHFTATVNDVRIAAQRGAYGDLRVGDEADIVIGKQAFRTIRFHFTNANRPVTSLTFLTVMHGKLLKFRMSFFEPTPPNLDKITRTFIQQHMNE